MVLDRDKDQAHFNSRTRGDVSVERGATPWVHSHTFGSVLT
jgi:hypothetical protein